MTKDGMNELIGWLQKVGEAVAKYVPAKEPDYWKLQQTVDIAIAHIRTQEARVLTYAEVMALPHGEENEAPVVMEQKVPVGEWDGGSLCQWRGARFVQERDHYYYNKDTYGSIWRVWTALPTKAQREGAKWDDD